MPGARRLSGPAAAALAAFLLLGLWAGRLSAANVAEVFLLLPGEECGGYNTAERQAMLKNIIAAPGAFGQASVPDVGYPWLRVVSDNFMVLERPGFGDISYKLFDGLGNFQILAVSRGRQRAAPTDPLCPFDLCLYRLDRMGLAKAEHRDLLPNISILDFITPDTLSDPDAARDIAALGLDFGHCLTNSLSAQDARRLEIITATGLNAVACNRFLPPHDLLPLTWDGLEFTKPYDRAAPKDVPL